MTASTALVIFDCDGVLVDSDRLSLEVQARQITALGLPMTAEECSREFLGIGMESTLDRIGSMIGKPVPNGWLEGLEAEVEEVFRRELRAVPGVVDALDENELPNCTASGGSHEEMELTLGLTKRERRDSNPRKKPGDRDSRTVSANRKTANFEVMSIGSR